MNKKGIYLQVSYKWSSVLLVLLLFSISIIQVVHTHNKEIQKELSNDEQSDSPAHQCKICDYFVHKQIKDFHLPPLFTLIISIPDPIQHTHTVVAGIYKFTLQGFTNKGPPLA